MPETDENDIIRPLVARLEQQVLTPLKASLIGKDEIIDVLAVGLISRENLFLHGPPGTAKSAIIRELSRRIDGQMFDYLLTRFTEPNELFGPFDIRRLREGELVTNTQGMFPEATLVFLDELLNANSAILNSLLMALNERVFRRGAETRSLPTLMVIGASNHLPEDEALRALFDRFLLRVPCVNVADEQLPLVLDAGWKLATTEHIDSDSRFPIADVETLQRAIYSTDTSPTSAVYLELIHRLRRAGFDVSDRRAVKYQKLVAASAIMCGRLQTIPSDLWVLRYTWDTVEQQEILKSLVDEIIDQQEAPGDVTEHPQSKSNQAVDAEVIARDLEALIDSLAAETESADRSKYRHSLTVLAERAQWVTNDIQRASLREQIEQAWARIGALA